MVRLSTRLVQQLSQLLRSLVQQPCQHGHELGVVISFCLFVCLFVCLAIGDAVWVTWILNEQSERRVSFVDTDTVSERLRRWTRNPLGSARRGSNLLGVDFHYDDGPVPY